MPSEAEFMRLARLECIFGATVKYNVVLAFPYDRRQQRHGHGHRRHRSYAGSRTLRARISSLPVHAGTAEPLRVSPPEAVAYPLELPALALSIREVGS